MDDNEFNIHALQLLLKSLQHRCDTALNGQEALVKVKKRQAKECGCRQYQLILLDCNMPILDGYDTCKILRSLIRQEKISPINIVAVTADVTPRNKQAC